jgi:hypothetical protein
MKTYYTSTCDSSPATISASYAVACAVYERARRAGVSAALVPEGARTTLDCIRSTTHEPRGPMPGLRPDEQKAQ